MSDSSSHRGAPDAAQKFVQKWSGVELSERAASHEHFIDLCALIGHPTPAQADPTGSEFTFAKPVKVTAAASKGSKGDGTGFVDVWKRGFFAKDKYKNLEEPTRQLYQYRDGEQDFPRATVAVGSDILHRNRMVMESPHGRP